MDIQGPTAAQDQGGRTCTRGPQPAVLVSHSDKPGSTYKALPFGKTIVAENHHQVRSGSHIVNHVANGHL